MASKVDSVFVLPVVDNRSNKQESLGKYLEPNDDKYAWNVAVDGHLKNKGYNYELSRDLSLKNGSGGNNVDELSPDEIKQIGNPSSKWVLAFYIDGFATESGLLTDAVAIHCTGRLFDKLQGEVVWRQKAKYDFGAGFLLSSTMTNPTLAISECVHRTLKTLPDKV